MIDIVKVFLFTLTMQNYFNNISFLELILGGIIGVIITELYEQLLKKYFNKVYLFINKRRHNKLYSSNKTYKFIMRYYKDRNLYNELFDCEINGYKKKITFLYSDNWSNLNIDILKDNVLKLYDGEPLNYKVNNHMIKKRKKLGQNIFNGKALYLSHATDIHCIEVKTCSFYEKLTLIDRIEKETYRLANCLFYRKTKYRNTLLSSFENSLSPLNIPLSIGCQVALIITYNDKQYICIDKRSDKTFTYGGFYSVIPNFGLEPISEDDAPSINETNQHNILLYNILKEYCEEIYNLNELEHNNRSNPFWFYEEFEPAKRLIESLQNNKSFCKFLGLGFDLINSLSIISVVLYITDQALSTEIYNDCKSNWEFNYSKIKFYPVDDGRLKEMLEKNEIQNGSAFTISLALNYLKKERNSNEL